MAGTCAGGMVHAAGGAAVTGVVTSVGFTHSVGSLLGDMQSKLTSLQARMASILPALAPLPAAKFFDIGVGIDLHPTTTPPSPLLPVPHVSIVFDLVAAIFSLLTTAFPPDPPPAEGEEPSPANVSSVARAIIKSMSPSVKVNGQWVCNAGAGIQHLPGIILHALPTVAPMAEGEVFMGSSTVIADGAPFTFQFLPELSCNLVGVPAPLRKGKMSGKKKISLMAPTSCIVGVIPSGLPVKVGGAPTIDLFAQAFALGLKGLGKLWKKWGGALFDKIFGKLDPEKSNRWKKLARCALFGEPVDAVTGRVYSENEEFRFSGPLPFVFIRRYYSDMDADSTLGRGWRHNYELFHTEPDPRGVINVRVADGRDISFPELIEGGSFFNPVERLEWRRENGSYFLRDLDSGLIYFYSSTSICGRCGAVMISDGAGHTIRLCYSGGEGLLRTLIDSCGRTFTFRYEDQNDNRLLTSVTFEDSPRRWEHRYCYNRERLLTRVTDAAGFHKELGYTEGLLTELRNQLGATFHWEYERTGRHRRCVHTWGDGGMLEYRITYRKGVTEATDSLGHTTLYEYDSSNLITRITDPCGGTRIFRYDIFQNPVLEIDQMGNSTKYDYDAHSNLTCVTDAYGEKRTYSYDSLDRLVGMMSPGGDRFSRSFNRHGEVNSVRYPDGSGADMEYSGGNPIRIIDASGPVTTLEWDSSHNLICITNPLEGQTRLDYDIFGRMIRSVAPDGGITEIGYDKVGNIVMLREPSGNVHRLTYDGAGDVLTARDSARSVEFTYDGLGQMTSRTEDDLKVRFVHDTESRLVAVFNENGIPYRFLRDGNGLVSEECSFAGIRHRYDRDLAGNVTQYLGPLIRNRYCYDRLGRVVTVDYADGTRAEYGYDRDSRLVLAQNGESQTLLKRVPGGAIVGEIQDGHVVDRSYDRYGRLETVRSGLGADLSLDYGAGGLFASVSGMGWGMSVRRDKMGRETERYLTGGVRSATEYGISGFVRRQSTSGRSPEVSSRRYSWDPSGQLRSLQTSHGNLIEFRHDARGFLTEGIYGLTERIYKMPDRVGNIYPDRRRENCTYDRDGRLLRDPKNEYRYDDEGNLIATIPHGVVAVIREDTHGRGFLGWLSNTTEDDKRRVSSELEWRPGMTVFEWNGSGSLQSVKTSSGAVVRFEYDALGRRTAKIREEGGSITRFLWAGNVPLHEWKYPLSQRPAIEVDSSGVRSFVTPEPQDGMVTWVFDPGTFAPAARISGGQAYNIITDYLGTPVEAYDESGIRVWSRELDIYGRVLSEKGEEGFVPFLYPGQYLDWETGLAYNRFRYYYPHTGNYISSDPIGLAGGNPTLYGYVMDVNYMYDLFGLAIPNMGDAPKHGGKGHNDRIDELITDLKSNNKVESIRKNQCQVNADGKVVGLNRPDVQYDYIRSDGYKVHHNVEFDTNPKSSAHHKEVITVNDSKAVNDFYVIDRGGGTLSHTH